MTNKALNPKHEDPAPGKPNDELTLDQLHERYLALVPDTPDVETPEGRQKLRDASAAILQDIKRFEGAAATLRLCRFCTMRHPPTKGTRYCYVTCVPNSPSRFPDPDPTGTLRRAYRKPPTLARVLADAEALVSRTSQDISTAR